MKPHTTFKALLAVVFWGASFVATKVALSEISPVAVVVLRFAIGLAVILAVLAWRRQVAAPRHGDVARLARLGAIGITAASFIYVEPIVTVVLAAALIGETITWPVVCGGVTIPCGVWMVNRRVVTEKSESPTVR